MTIHRSDPALIRACLDGRESAWNELVDRYGRLVYSVPRRLGLPEADCDDVMQSVFVALYRHLSSLNDATRLSAWLITTAHRESWRVCRTRPVTREEVELSAEAETPDDELELLELQDMIRQGLAALGGRCEALLRALYLGRTQSDLRSVSAQLDMPMGSIGPTRARCLKKLEAWLIRNGMTTEGEVVGRV